MAASLDQIAATLREEAAKALAGHPNLRHEWSNEGAVVTLHFPPADARGFEVAIQAGEGYLYVLMGRNHQPFDVDARNPRDAVTAALGLVRDLLSPNMRLRELRAAERPYRWLPTTEKRGSLRLRRASCSSTSSASVPSMCSRTTSFRVAVLPNPRLQRPAAATALTGAAAGVLGSNAAAAEPPGR